MKAKLLLFLSFILISTFSVVGQRKYYNADQFPLFGKISDVTETRYERLPSYLKGKTRQPVWELGKNTAGLSMRFTSNTTSVSLKWTLFQNRRMTHMSAIGIRGFDLYCRENGNWVFVNSARPSLDNFENETVIVSNMTEREREYLLFFPLYDGVTELEIGIDSLASISSSELVEYRQKRPIISYGTSILQGGCASRPGMSHLNILARALDREFINLGFSANGHLDYEIAELIANAHNPALIILDFMPNVNAQKTKERTEKFYRIIREKHPETPIIFVENPIYPQMRHDTEMAKAVNAKNIELNIIFNKLKNDGDRNILLLSSKEIIGIDGEATVDGIHFTDLGFMRYADFLKPYINAYLR